MLALGCSVLSTRGRAKTKYQWVISWSVVASVVKSLKPSVHTKGRTLDESEYWMLDSQGSRLDEHTFGKSGVQGKLSPIVTERDEGMFWTLRRKKRLLRLHTHPSGHRRVDAMLASVVVPVGLTECYGHWVEQKHRAVAHKAEQLEYRIVHRRCMMVPDGEAETLVRW